MTSTVYPLLGRAQDSLDDSSKGYNISFPAYLGTQYDASTTNLSYTIRSPQSTSDDVVELTLSFLSPITPTSTLRQSIPASYLAIHATGAFDVNVYIDLNEQWVTGYGEQDTRWSFNEVGEGDEAKLKTFKFKRNHELLFTEHRDRAEWGELHLTGPTEAQHGFGSSEKLRRQFAEKGALEDELDEKFQPTANDGPVVAFSKRLHLGTYHNVSSAGNPAKQDRVLFTIAHLQDPVTQFASARGLTYMRPLWKSYFHSDDSLISFHYKDYANAFQLAANYSAQVAKDAYASGSDNYKDIVELSARQVMGATSFSGTPDNPLLFLKEISSNGNCQTIDVIFPSFPFFLYTNPRWLAYLLEPLIEHMGSGQYPNQYAMHDLGAHFPNLTGHPLGRDEYMPVEECGDIIIMGLALVHSLIHGEGLTAGSILSMLGIPKDGTSLKQPPDGASPFALPAELEIRNPVGGLDDQWCGAKSKHRARKWLSRSYGLWKQWTSYLVEFSLFPQNQLCTDDFAGWLALQTNLALKGIVGIKAMSEISELMDEQKDAKYYRNISDVYIKKWEEYGMSRDGGRAKLAYNWYGSWTTLYSLYANAILCFHPNPEPNETASPLLGSQHPLMPGFGSSMSSKNFIPDHIYQAQSRWYSTVMQYYGLPLDSRHLYTKSDWEFQAAAVASKHTRTQILDRVARWLNETATDKPFSDLYKTEDDGGFPGPNFFARPVVGSHFAFLALERACGGTAARAFDYEE